MKWIIFCCMIIMNITIFRTYLLNFVLMRGIRFHSVLYSSNIIEYITIFLSWMSLIHVVCIYLYLIMYLKKRVLWVARARFLSKSTIYWYCTLLLNVLFLYSVQSWCLCFLFKKYFCSLYYSFISLDGMKRPGILDRSLWFFSLFLFFQFLQFISKPFIKNLFFFIHQG